MTADLTECDGLDVEVTETTWTPKRDLSQDEWHAVGQGLLHVGRGWQWWIGDWFIYGEQRSYAEAIEVVGLRYRAFAKIVSVARRVAPERRRSDLSWSHHEVVAVLEPSGQLAWLQRAADEGLTVERLRSALRSVARGEVRGRREARDAPVAGTGWTTTITFVTRASGASAARSLLRRAVRLAEEEGFTVIGTGTRRVETLSDGRLAQAEEWLREFLADGPAAARDGRRLAREAGISDYTLRRARRSLGVVPRRERSGKRITGWRWELPAVSDVVRPRENA